MDVVERLPGRVSGRALVAFLAAVAVVPWLLPNQYLVHVVVAGGHLRHPRRRPESLDGLRGAGLARPRRLLRARRLRVGGALGALRAHALARHADRRPRHRRPRLRRRHPDAAAQVVLPRHGHARHRRGAAPGLRPAPPHHRRVVRARGNPALGSRPAPLHHRDRALLSSCGPSRRVASLGRAQPRQRARRPRAARAPRERGRGGGDGRRHRGGEAPRLRAVRGVRLGGGQPLRALHHGDQPGDLLVPVLGRPRPDGGDRRHRAVLGRGGGRGAADRIARGPAPLRRLGGAALRPRPHRRDPVPAARHRRALRARGAGARPCPLVHTAVLAPAVRAGIRPLERRASLRRSRAHGPAARDPRRHQAVRRRARRARLLVRRRRRRDQGGDRPERRGQDHAVQRDHRLLRADGGRGPAARRAGHRRCPPIAWRGSACRARSRTSSSSPASP